MKVLIVGGAGYVASIIRPALEAAHDCFYFDRQPIADRAERATVGDVLDEALVGRAVAGMEGIIYTAMGAPPGAPFGVPGPRTDVRAIGPAFGVNAGGLYAFLAAGLAAGVRRFVYASSLSVYRGNGPSEQVSEELPADGFDAYAMSKRCGELVCQAAAQSCPEATIVALRLMAPRNAADYAKAKEANPETPYLGPHDTSTLFLAALACAQRGAHILQTTGDVREKRYSLARAAAMLGWRPEGR